MPLEVEVLRQEVEVSPNLSGSGKKKAQGKAGQSAAGVITGEYPAVTSEQENLEKAATLVAKAQEATKRYRLRQKTTQGTPQKDARKPEVESATKEPPPPASKKRAARGTVGTFCGRRPPSNPEAAAEFAAIRDAYYQMRADSKALKTTGKRKSPDAEAYYDEMRKIMSDLKEQHPGQPSRWIFAEAQKVRASRSSDSTSPAKAKKEKKGAEEKEKKPKTGKTGKKDDKEKDDKKAKKAKKGKKEKEEKDPELDADGQERQEHMGDELRASDEGEEREETAPVGEESGGQDVKALEDHINELRAGEEGDEQEEEHMGDERMEGEIPEYEEHTDGYVASTQLDTQSERAAEEEEEEEEADHHICDTCGRDYTRHSSCPECSPSQPSDTIYLD